MSGRTAWGSMIEMRAWGGPVLCLCRADGGQGVTVSEVRVCAGDGCGEASESGSENANTSVIVIVSMNMSVTVMIGIWTSETRNTTIGIETVIEIPIEIGSVGCTTLALLGDLAVLGTHGTYLDDRDDPESERDELRDRRCLRRAERDREREAERERERLSYNSSQSVVGKEAGQT